jgi:hypothetical protein
MQYALLIYSQEPTSTPSNEEIQAEIAAYDVFTKSIRDSGAFVAGEALHPSPTATTVRVRDGQTLTTDGPFAETKEVFGGFYLVNAADLDEAIAMASRIPTAQHGSIEVRPVVQWDDPTGSGAPTREAVAG